MGERYTAQDFITAIPGTGGIVSAIARKVGCEWETARAWIDKYPTVKRAYDAECEAMLDLAESAVLRNIKLAAQGEGDTADAKWYLTKKGKRRNYGDAMELTGEGGGPVQTEIVIRYADANSNTNAT
jgi:transposase-like protein